MNSVQIFHQCGFREKWNMDSLEQDHIGNGLILSPVNMSKEQVAKLQKELKEKSFFDPQFYLPRSTKEKLNTYDFFPNNITEGYSTVLYEEYAYESASKCISFQISNDFRYLIIPTLYYENLPANYLEIQEQLFIEPFLAMAEKQNNNKPILLSIILKDVQLEDEEYRNDLLNFITGHTQINGVYLIPEHKESYKRIRNATYLYNLMVFIHILKENQLTVHVGYVDVEAYILTLTGLDSISIGGYENLRKFGVKKFEEHEKKKQMGPNPRIYSAKLFQWIEYNYLAPMRSLYAGYDMLFDKTAYQVEMFKPEFHWHFSKPEIYKHFFVSFGHQIQQLPNDYETRYSAVKENLQQAMGLFEEIKKSVMLDSDSNGDHIAGWINAISMYDKYLRG